MTDSLGDLLQHKNMAEPPEIRAVKDFVRDAFQAECSVAVKPDQLIVTVPSAALAGTLRLHLVELQAAANTQLRIVIRIGV